MIQLWNKKEKIMTGRSKEETADITLLGNQKTQYPSDYAPAVSYTHLTLPTKA